MHLKRGSAKRAALTKFDRKIDDGAVYVNYEEDQLTSKEKEDEWTLDIV